MSIQEPPGATYEAPPTLIHRTGEHYRTPDVLLLAHHLTIAGWRRGALKASTEAARLWKNGALILVYLPKFRPK